MGQVIELGGKRPALLIAAHGDMRGPARNSPLRALAAAVRQRLPGLPVASCVLNGEPSPGAALRECAGHSVLVYPLFMSGGHYVETALPACLGGKARGTGRDVTILPPLGLDPALPALVARRVCRVAPASPYSASRTSVLVIAHGSTRGPQPRLAAERFSDGLRQCLRIGPIHTAYLEEPPFAEDAVAALPARSVVISFFAGRGAHGDRDVTNMLLKAGRAYVPVVGPVGADPNIADLVVGAVSRELPDALGAACSKAAAGVAPLPRTPISASWSKCDQPTG